MTSPAIHRVTTLDLAVRPWSWPFAQARRAEIDAHFAEKQREKPAIWNGRVLLGRNPVFSGERFSASYFETDFASFLAWRDWGFPDKGVFNGFGMGALRSHDGAFVLGEMGQHTANAGRIYFPVGHARSRRCQGRRARYRRQRRARGRGGDRSRARTITGRPRIGIVSYTGHAVAMMRMLHVEMPGEALRARIEANLARQHQPELEAIHLVRGTEDITAAMPRFVTAFIEAHLTPQP